MIRIIIVAFMIFTINCSFSQNDSINEIKGEMERGSHSHIISVRSILGFDYTFAQSVSKYSSIGYSVGLGLGGNILLSHPDYEAQTWSYPENMQFSASSPKVNFQFLNFSMFYERYIFRKIYVGIGFRASRGYVFINPEKLVIERFYGGFLSIYYGNGKVKFGHELQIGNMVIESFDKTTSGPTILLTPFVVRFVL
ncbi:MAG: hypothetical protein DRJ05_05995 [Bacteroidetes bacterium]|nr:MAG: hypothetical protein DRJ05_05995 [Bacteroidota bacterium]